MPPLPTLPAADDRRAGSRASRKPATRPRTQRRTARGDIAPRPTAQGIATHTVGESVGAAHEAQAQALRDIARRAAQGEWRCDRACELGRDGAGWRAPDEVIALRRLLRKHERDARAAPRCAGEDTALSDDWRMAAATRTAT